jgi:hypothetical protein
MNRPMFLGETIDMTPSVLNQLITSRPHSIGGLTKRWANHACDPDPAFPDPKPYPYKTVLEAHIPAFDGRLGTVEVIVLLYFQLAQYERFYYAKDIGWIKWELYSQWKPGPEAWFDEVVERRRRTQKATASRSSNRWPASTRDRSAVTVSTTTRTASSTATIRTARTRATTRRQRRGVAAAAVGWDSRSSSR